MRRLQFGRGDKIGRLPVIFLGETFLSKECGKSQVTSSLMFGQSPKGALMREYWVAEELPQTPQNASLKERSDYLVCRIHVSNGDSTIAS